MTESEVLGEKRGSGAKEGGEGPQKQSNQARHDERIRADNESKGVGLGDMRTEAARGTSTPALVPYGILARHNRFWNSGTRRRGGR